MYSFDPLKYGFEPISNYPELQQFYGETTLIRITIYDNFNGLVYWYTTCRLLGHDDRVEILSGAYDTRKGQRNDCGRTVYLGLISSEEFAEDLLKHLLAASNNDSVKVEGIERFNQRLGAKMRQEFLTEK